MEPIERVYVTFVVTVVLLSIGGIAFAAATTPAEEFIPTALVLGSIILMMVLVCVAVVAAVIRDVHSNR